MARSKCLKSRLNPKSGNQYVDWVFRRIVKILGNAKCYNNKDLRNPADKRKKIFGCTDRNPRGKESVIFINSDAHSRYDEPIAKTLIHESLHDFFTGYAPKMHGRVEHSLVFLLEDLLYEKFTPDQKAILESYIPRHSVKKEP